MNNIIIPESLHLVIDDLGWFCGTDDRKNGGPSRSGMPRRHCAEDYIAVNELGRRINMKISCAFVVGEWDPDNRLKKIPHLSKYGDLWDNALYLDAAEMKKCAAAVNSSEYIDLNIHGLLHGYYIDGIDNYDTSDYYYRVDGVRIMTDEQEIRNRLDAFLNILDYHGIKKKIDSFVPPSFCYGPFEISGILKDYNIKYVSTIFKNFGFASSNGIAFPSPAGVENGIITIDRNINIFPFDKPECDPRELPVKGGVFGIHWPNVLHCDPSKHSEITDMWVEYFNKCADTFGIILSRDISFAATQSLYTAYAKTECKGENLIIDISEVPEAHGKSESFYISSKNKIKDATGCEISLHEVHNGFYNYKVTPKSKILVFS